MTKQEWREHFSKELRYLMTINKITTGDIERDLGITRATVHYWIQCKTAPTIFSIIKLAIYFDVSLEDLTIFGDNISD